MGSERRKSQTSLDQHKNFPDARSSHFFRESKKACLRAFTHRQGEREGGCKVDPIVKTVFLVFITCFSGSFFSLFCELTWTNRYPFPSYFLHVNLSRGFVPKRLMKPLVVVKLKIMF